MARILLIAQYYPPEIGAIPSYTSEMAARLVRRGHEVTVVTTLPNYPTGIVHPDYRRGKNRRETRDGVTIVRVWSATSPKKRFLHRLASYLTFALLAPLTAARAVGQPDIMIGVAPPLFTSIAVRLLAWRKRCPFIFNVGDLWPESAIQLGVLKNPVLIWLAERLEWSTYRRAGAIWALTEGIRDTLVRRGIPAAKVFMLPLGVDTARFQPMPRAQARALLGMDDRFTLLYAGNIGLAQGLDTVIEAADELRDRPDIRLLLVGNGAAKPDLVAQAERRGLDNVVFVDSQPPEHMPAIIAAADACLVSLRKLPLFDGALPSKMFEFMACARPLVLSVDGEARRVAERDAMAAIFAEPENAQALAGAVRALRDDPRLGPRLGANGRAYVDAHYDRERLVASLEERIETLLEQHGGPIKLRRARSAAVASGRGSPD